MIHAAYIHTSWWFKKDGRKLRPKEKSFEPSPLGWRMVRHKLPPQNLVYKLLGKESLGTDQMPAAGTPIFHTLGYVMHDGGHGTIPSDWDLFLREAGAVVFPLGEDLLALR